MLNRHFKGVLIGSVGGLICGISPFVQALVITPTTTVALETQNNTSTSNTFAGQTNGDLPPSNISKVATSTLLYPQAKTTIYAHFMPWFCMSGAPNCSCDMSASPPICHGHVLSGYNSDDATQVHSQVTDMLSRGLQGAVIDWYGPTYAIENGTSLLMKADAETRGSSFHFVIQDDGGQYSTCMKDSSCNVEAAIIADLVYAGATFVSSPNYAKTSDGRPIMMFFDPDGEITSLSGGKRTINWATVAAGVAAYNYAFIFMNSGSFTHANTSGGFAWPQPTTSSDPSFGYTYLSNFYNTAQSHSSLHAFASTYKGFNDSLATWSPPDGPKLIGQGCGQTWLETFTLINNVYGGSHPALEYLQLATWNDYDEGTTLETGIDNCLSITSTINTSKLNWSITGSSTTLDHFTVFISSDNVNLMVLKDNLSPTTLTLDLSTLGLPAGTSYLYVKAVGKASILNHLSNSVSYGGGALTSNAQFVSQIVPSTMMVGQTYMMAVTMKNTGTTTWNNPGKSAFGLGAQNPQDNKIWGFNRVYVPSTATILAGQNYTFLFNVVAASTTGNYNFQWRMMQENVNWFGNDSGNVSITVQKTSNPVPTLSSVTPSSATAGGAKFKLFANGTNFVKDVSVIQWNGVGYKTYFYSSKKIGCWIPATLIASTGTAKVSVFTAGPGGGTSPVQTFTILPAASSALFISQVVPKTMTAGGTYSVQITLQNDGSFPWVNTGKNGYGLGSQNAQDNKTWGLNRVYISTSEVIVLGSTKTFTFNVTAPSTAGTYNFEWRMLQENMGWFGDSTPNVAITVQKAGPQSIPLTLVPSTLASIRVYPNPWRADRHSAFPVTFDQLPLNSTVKIFTVSAREVKTLSLSGTTARWDLTNDSGDKVASGLYIYLIEADQNEKRTGQIAVIR